MAEIEAIVSDFGGVLTTPLLTSFMAVQDEIGISPENLGKAMQAITEEDGENPLFELERGEITEVDFLERLERRAGAAARPPAGAAPLPRDLLRGAPPEPADDRADARAEGGAASGWRC